MPRVIHRVSFKIFLSLLLISGTAYVATASTVIVPSDDTMIIESRAIVCARVLSVSASFDKQTGYTYTFVRLRIRQVFKGDITSSEIVLKQFGGSTNAGGTVIFDAPQFNTGEMVILFLDTWTDGSLRVHDQFLGKYSIVTDRLTGKRVVERGAPSEEVQVVARESGTHSTDRMELSAYLKMLRTRMSADMESSQKYADQYYRTAPILMSAAGYSANQRGIQPEYHFFNPPARWFGPDTGQSVTVLIDPTGAPSGTQADVDAAMVAWSTVANCSLRVTDGGGATPGACNQSGVSIVEFNNCHGFFSGGGTCQGILAEGGFSYTTGGSKVVSGITFYQITFGFVSFNPFAACYFSQHCNVQEITTHEMGHSLGMHHSWDPTFGGSSTATDRAATMYYIAHFDGRCASVKSDDIAGISTMYPGASTPTAGTTVAVYQGAIGMFSLRNSNTAGAADLVFQYGPTGTNWIPVAGDWTGSGVKTIGLYDPATASWFLKNANSGGSADLVFQYGPAGSNWMPVVGDWNGDGIDTVGLFDPAGSVFFLKNTNAAGAADLVFQYGPAGSGWKPIVGDWTGSGTDTVGLYNASNGFFFLKNSNSGGAADTVFQFGPANPPGWVPVVGDWDGNKTETVGFFAPGTTRWFLKNANSAGAADISFLFGLSQAVPITGKWQ